MENNGKKDEGKPDMTLRFLIVAVLATNVLNFALQVFNAITAQ